MTYLEARLLIDLAPSLAVLEEVEREVFGGDSWPIALKIPLIWAFVQRWRTLGGTFWRGTPS